MVKSKTKNYHKKHLIRINGEDAPRPWRGFAKIFRQLSLPTSLKKYFGVEFLKPTPIQAQCIPAIAKGRDVVGCSPTGTGKTFSFLLPMLSRLSIPPERELKQGPEPKMLFRALILSPTLELSQQTFRLIKKHYPDIKAERLHPLFSKHGGITDVLVGTPCSLNAKLHRADFTHLECLVVDEIDQMFIARDVMLVDFDRILKVVPATTQKLFFSATIDQSVVELAKSVLVDPLFIHVGKPNVPAPHVQQRLVFAGSEAERGGVLLQQLSKGIETPALVFANKTQNAVYVHKLLLKHNYRAGLIHSRATHRERGEALAGFVAGDILFLVTTDVLTRGMDFPEIKTILSYDFPHTRTNYIHRIGRAGRMGRSGQSVVFFTKENREKLHVVGQAVASTGQAVEGWMVNRLR